MDNMATRKDVEEIDYGIYSHSVYVCIFIYDIYQI